MRVLIVGYGSMGKEVEKALLSRNHQVSARVDPGGQGDELLVSDQILKDSDGVIEFALADGLKDNATRYSRSGLPVVIGTTGWLDQLEEIKTLYENSESALLYGSNFSPGAHIFFALAEKTSAIINNLPQYDMMLHEYHHKNKMDSPSGTAITAAQRILNASTRKTRLITDKLNRKIQEDELHVSSTRGGSIPGIHTFTVDCEADSISIEHNARNRGGFALGSVLALEWLEGKKGLYTVEQFMQEILGGLI